MAAARRASGGGPRYAASFSAGGTGDSVNGVYYQFGSVQLHIMSAVPRNNVRAVSRPPHQVLIEQQALLFQLLDLTGRDLARYRLVPADFSMQNDKWQVAERV